MMKCATVKVNRQTGHSAVGGRWMDEVTPGKQIKKKTTVKTFEAKKDSSKIYKVIASVVKGRLNESMFTWDRWLFS